MKNKVKFRQLGSVTLFVLPALIPLIVFWIYPILRSVYISFTDWDYMTPDYNFVFFDNFISLFQDARFYDALWNTVVFTLGTLIPTIVLGLMLALLMQKAFKGSGIIKFILFSPWITPTVAVSIVWTWIYDPNTGIANTVMRFLHARCDHCDCVEESRICDDLLSFRIGKGSERVVRGKRAGWSKKVAEIPGCYDSVYFSDYVFPGNYYDGNFTAGI